MGEFHNKKVRRKLSPAQRKADLARRVKLRDKFNQYTLNPLNPDDTVRLVQEELQLIQHFRSQGEVWIKMWTLLNQLTHLPHTHVAESRPRRQAMLALMQRMLREKKLIRHRKSNTVALADWLR